MIVRLLVPVAAAALYPFCSEWVMETGGLCHGL